MAIKKSQLYSALWEGCNALRGGMDASQYKDYVLTMLFLKYISDKQKADPSSMLYTIPEGCTFDDVLRIPRNDIGDELNKILAKIGKEFMNDDQFFREADFNDSQKLGSGKDLVDTVWSLIGEFQRPGLDFGHNRAADDDLIGDAYEYLMRKFAQSSGKSKGQFYTPAEASRLAAELLDIRNDSRNNISIYDMTCGSGSLLLRAANESKAATTSLHGQEIDISTLRMSRLNMILHGKAGYDDLRDGDTINAPKHIAPDGKLQTFDYCVANPPYSVKNWRKSALANDEYGRWNEDVIGLPPDSKGDFAFLLHMIKSMKPTGKGSCFLPHGVLFRGSVEKGEGEAMVRKYLCKQRLISGIIGLPANIFYGTGIPTCIVVIDKAGAKDSEGIFMIDAKAGFVKDGDKNRLREQDIRRVCDTWFAKAEVPHYSRMVSWKEIEDNGFNLNIPRYVQPADTEAQQNLDAHLNGGIPVADVDVLQTLWDLCPSLRNDLFAPLREGFMQYTPAAAADIDATIQANASYQAQQAHYHEHIDQWQQWMKQALPDVCLGCQPKMLIQQWGRHILEQFADCKSLVDNYDVYDELCKYWEETMQDDAYMVSRDGWKVIVELPKDKKGNVKKSYSYEDITCDLLPSMILVKACFTKELSDIETHNAKIETLEAEIAELTESHEDDFSGYDKVAQAKNAYDAATAKVPIEGEKEVLMTLLDMPANNKAAKEARTAFINEHADIFEGWEKFGKSEINKRMKEIDAFAPLMPDTIKVFKEYLDKNDVLSALKTELKVATAALTKAVQDKYAVLTEDEVRELVFAQKWIPTMRERLESLMKTAQQAVSADLHTLNTRYENTLSELSTNVNEFEAAVISHLKEMGF